MVYTNGCCLYFSDCGGIYLDPDELIVKPLDKFRNSSFTVHQSRVNSITNDLLISEPGALLIRLWLESYHNYKPREWAINSCRIPFQIAMIFPHLVRFTETNFPPKTWKDMHSVHGVADIVKGQEPKTWHDLRTMKTGTAEAMRFIYYGSPDRHNVSVDGKPLT